MSQRDVEATREFIDAFNRRDRGAMSGLLHPEAEWHSLSAPVFGIGTLEGRDEVLRFLLEQVTEVFDDFRVVVEETRELPSGEVLVSATYRGRGAGSGAMVDMKTAGLYRFEAGKLRFFQDFETQAEALQAVGLRE